MSDVATAALSLMLHLGKPDVDTPWWHPNRLRVHHRVVSESQYAVDPAGAPIDAGAVATPPPNQAFRCRPQAPYPSNDFTCDEPVNPISSPAPSRAVGPGDVAEAAEEMELPSLRVSVQPAGSTLVNLETIFHTTAAPFERTVDILDSTVDLRASPAAYTWHHGDGTTQTTTTPGRPYPAMDVTHEYQRPGHVSPSVDVTYRVTYRIDDGDWQTLDTTITAPGPATPLRVREARPVLTP